MERIVPMTSRAIRTKRALLWCALVAPFVFLVVILIRAVPSASGGSTTIEEGAVIPPGRESEVMTFLGSDLNEGFAGEPISDVRIDHDTIVLQLEPRAGETIATCDLPAGVSVPGAVSIAPANSSAEGDGMVEGDLRVSWRLCPSVAQSADEASRRLADRLAVRPHANIWRAAEKPSGVLSAFLLHQPFTPRMAIALVLFMAALLAIIAASLAPSAPETGSAPRRARPWLIGLRMILVIAIVLGVVMRFRAAAHLSLDVDEVWALPDPRSILSNDHDAWVHPPLFRALQQAWVRAIGWHDGSGLLALRVPSLAASIAALAIISAHMLFRTSPIAGVVAVVIALSPTLIENSILARPYSLVTLGVSVVVVALLRRMGEPPTKTGWLLALVGTGIVAWTDLLAGVAMAVFLMLSLGQQLMRTPRPALALVGVASLATILFLAPLVPGALVAAREQRHPPPRADGKPVPDLLPEQGPTQGRLGPLVGFVASVGLGGRYSSDGRAGAVMTVLLLGVGSVIVVTARRSRDASAAVAPLMLVALAIVAGRSIAVRPRNILFVPLGMAVLTANAISAIGSGRRGVDADLASRSSASPSAAGE